MVPPPSSDHQGLGVQLLVFLHPLALAHGLSPFYETGLFRSGGGPLDYRVPDLMIARPERVAPQGVEGSAELVIEILSPNDESRAKLPFYEALGVQEVLLIDPATRAAELYVLRGERLHAALPDEAGTLRVSTLGFALRSVDGHLVLEAPSSRVEL